MERSGWTRLLYVMLILIVLVGAAGAMAGGDGSGQPPAAREQGGESGPGAHHGDPAVAVFEALAIVTACAAIGRYATRRLGQSPVLGELLMGILLGAVLYQVGRPTVFVLRHADLVKETVERVQREDVRWEQAVRETVEASTLSAASRERLREIMLDPGFPAKARLAQTMMFFSSLGIVLLLFMVGLENSVDEMLRLGGKALAVGTTGVVATFAIGIAATYLLFAGRGHPLVPVFMAASMCSTSVGISARVFMDMGRLDMGEAKMVLGAGVVDDILGLIVLAVVVGVVATGSVSVGTILLILVKAAVFLAAVVVFGKVFLGSRVERFVSRAGTGENLALLLPFALLMVLAALADTIGLSTIIGAFAAGLVIEERRFAAAEPGHQDASVESLLAPIQELFAPIFFVLIGLQVDVTTLLSPSILLAGLIMSAVAIAGKLCAPLPLGKGYDKLIVGAGLVPRGEVQLIFATLGKSLGVIDDGQFSVIVMVVLVTTVLAPAMLKRIMERSAARAAAPE